MISSDLPAHKVNGKEAGVPESMGNLGSDINGLVIIVIFIDPNIFAVYTNNPKTFVDWIDHFI